VRIYNQRQLIQDTSAGIKREKMMQEQNYVQQKSGAKALALDDRIFLTKIRLLQLLALTLSAAFALGLHQIFAR
jgi:hypothetical protein